MSANAEEANTREDWKSESTCEIGGSRFSSSLNKLSSSTCDPEGIVEPLQHKAATRQEDATTAIILCSAPSTLKTPRSLASCPLTWSGGIPTCQSLRVGQVIFSRPFADWKGLFRAFLEETMISKLLHRLDGGGVPCSSCRAILGHHLLLTQSCRRINV
mmetsp:Transcript_17435/g.26332  ORF Transcript_17435/g.26332 Transcript_17435/m.26332 type:complete len:159 (-) Transcript_17435:280-756(-)